MHRDFNATYQSYVRGWRRYDAVAAPAARRASGAYWLSVNVVKASEDKTFPGAIVASLASPWGQAVSAGDTPGGNPSTSAPTARSSRATSTRPTRGCSRPATSPPCATASGSSSTASSWPTGACRATRCSTGRRRRTPAATSSTSPRIRSCWPTRPGSPAMTTLWPKIRAAADFVVAHGPSFGSERWEEQGGYSPSTIAAEIAGLVAAARIADVHGDRRRRARVSVHGGPLPALDQGLDGHDDRARTAPGATSSGCRGPATRTRRSRTAWATAAHGRPAVGDRRGLPRARPARDPAAGRRRRASARCRSWTTSSAG